MTLAEHVKRAGVVGAGGGGFPTHVKLSGRADTVIANGAECEPLLHKDAACLEHAAAAVVEGVRLSMQAVGAERGYVAVKAKKDRAVEAVRAACAGSQIELRLLGDYYPAGDEYDLVHEVTGRLIPPSGIPLDVGVLVANVETFANVAEAARGRPVIEKLITVAGAVKEAVTLKVPIGTSLREAILHAGGALTEDPVLAVGGLMMGKTTTDADTPVTKTTAGVVVLPRDHRIALRKLSTPASQRRIGKSACDQCRYCTELCPRYLLGYPVEPHQVMRTLAFTASGNKTLSAFGALCCACGLCTLYACPEDLFPKEACDDAKVHLSEAGILPPRPAAVKPHPLRDGRRVPIGALVRKLNVKAFDRPAPLSPAKVHPAEVKILLKQGAGVANQPIVALGDSVRAGQPLGAIAEGALGALVHAPFEARVTALTDEAIVLSRLS